MLKGFVKRVVNRAGYDIHKLSPTGWRWSYHVGDYYPVDPEYRWGYGKPPHPQLSEILKGERSEYSSVLKRISQSSAILNSIRQDGDAEDTVPYWNNTWFENLDPVSLVGILASFAPKKYFEIGSGNSTKFARYTIQRAGLATSITSVDPLPRATIDSLCDKVIRARLEDCDLSLFDQLEAGDILFFDGSHRAFTNSDVTVFFLDVLPRLKPGVIIHIHDIFLPWDYPPDWKYKMYSEQYVLAAMLLARPTGFKVLLPNFFCSEDQELREQVKSLVEPLGCIARGWSFWFEKT